MEKNELMRKFWAGLFFVLGIFLILKVIFVLGEDKGFAKPKFTVTVLFSKVGGLLEGAPVQLSGVNIGHVDDIYFLERQVEGRGVAVRLNIFSRFRKQLQRSVLFTIKTEGILGEKIVEIESFGDSPVVDLQKPILGEDAVDVQDLAIVFSRAAESFTKTSEDFNKIEFDKLTEILAESAQSLSSTSKALRVTLEETQDITKKTRRLIDRVEQKIIDGNLFKVF